MRPQKLKQVFLLFYLPGMKNLLNQYIWVIMKFAPTNTRLCRIYWISILIMLLYSTVSIAQQKAPKNIFAPLLAQKLKAIPLNKKIKVIITCEGDDLPAMLKNDGTAIKRLGVFNQQSFFEVTLPVNTLLTKAANEPAIIFIEDGARMPKEELRVGNLDLSLNNINTMQRQFPQWNGAGITVSIKENKLDTTDIDFTNRFLSTNLSSSMVSTHASVMATMMGGGGNSWHLGKGAAWGSTISSSDFTSLLPDANTSYQQYNISVQNHSYGVGIENYYGADAAAYDATAIDNPSLLHIFSSGNSGLSASSTGIYTGIKGYANITGSFKMAKNILTVGATDSFTVIAPLSSKGPAYDGRVKPELEAYGEDGSSGAAALVSGISLVLQQQYQQINGSMPANALIKASLINSADDTGNPELDYSNGYGSLNALKAVKTIQAGHYFSGSVANGGNQVFSVTVPTGIKKIKVTLVWNDPPAAPNAARALVNDLDLTLINTASGEAWEPWVLNPFPNADSLQKPATRKRDSLNNIEQVTLGNPVAGIYQFAILGYAITGLPQHFYIAYQFDSTDIFEWHFPTSSDFIFSASTNTIRWASSFNRATGALEYSVNNGTDWQLIDQATDLSKGYYQWQAPAGIHNSLLRMTIGNNQFVSDSFTISQKIQTGVGFNCPDSFLIYWDSLPGIHTYHVYTTGYKYLEPLATTASNYLVLSKSSNPSRYYAVAPVIGKKEAVKSFTFDYTNQGVECYFRTFYAILENNIVRLNLSLGTLYHLDTIILEKMDGRNFTPLQQLTNINSPEAIFTDALLTNGINSYRIKLVLKGGGTIYSSIETVYNFAGSAYIIYPNPVGQQQVLNILTNDVFSKVTLQVFNNAGQKAGEYAVTDLLTTIATDKFGKGLYFFRFIKAGTKDTIMKVIIR
jgi:hypothetical protein